MKQVRDAFNSLPGGDIPLTEFKAFWVSLTDADKETFKANAAAMGFTA